MQANENTQHDSDEAARIYRAYGPPGCGKTNYLKRQIRHAAQKYGSDTLLITSFTKAAAVTLAETRSGEDPLPLRENQIGTLHSLCYQQLGKPPIAESAEHLAEWNEHSHSYALSGAKRDVDEAAVDMHHETKADELMAQYQRLRARMIARELWPGNVRLFAMAWEGWKKDTGYIDFTDMIDLARTAYNTPTPPHGATILMLDEAQDCPPNQMALFKAWMKQCQFGIICGDDDQTIYTHSGASPETMRDPDFKMEFTTVLNQSYRVPAAVQRVAEAWIAQVQHREPKEYRPRHEIAHDLDSPIYEGSVRTIRANYKQPEEAIKDAERQIDAGKSVMFLASCSYMLPPVIAVLKKSGIPFHNDYRKSRGDWNPLKGDTKRSTSTATRVLAFLANADPSVDEYGHDRQHPWTGRELKQWTKMIASKGILERGAKTLITELADDLVVPTELMLSLFDDEAYEAAFMGDLDWLEAHITAEYRDTSKYPIQLARLRGPQILRATPQCTVGTIHSVKGGEADVVYLFPDISVAGMQEWARRAGRDSIIRQFYVAISRCRESLVLCQPVKGLYSAHISLEAARQEAA